MKNFTVVYVFGPTRCHEKYSANTILDRANGEWVKIGQTDIKLNPSVLSDNTVKESVDAAAKKRITEEVRTGISDWCDIYDAFLFPKAGIQIDNAIRNLLTNDIYELDNSKAERNKGLGDISPGKEYVYGCSRNHIKHAVESYDHQLIVSSDATGDDLITIKKICEFNSIFMNEDGETENEGKKGQSHAARLNLDMILSQGDEVILVNGKNPILDENSQPIKAVYAGNMKFTCQGETACSSPLAGKLMDRYCKTRKPGQGVNGNEHWMYNGKLLTEYRKTYNEKGE